MTKHCPNCGFDLSTVLVKTADIPEQGAPKKAAAPKKKVDVVKVPSDNEEDELVDKIVKNMTKNRKKKAKEPESPEVSSESEVEVEQPVVKPKRRAPAAPKRAPPKKKAAPVVREPEPERYSGYRPLF
jgi:hypothetical protein